MPQATVLIDGSDLARFISQFGGRAKHMHPAMRDVGETLLGYVDEELETSGHGRFPPLAPSTLRRKARMGWSSKPLFATGAMAAANFVESGDDYAEVKNSKPYSIFHVSKAPRTKIPLRDFFDIQEEAFDESAQIILNHLAGK